MAIVANAQNWDVIRNSGEYYYGVGTGKDVQEAKVMAMDNMTSSIVTHVSSSFDQNYFQKSSSGNIDYTDVVRTCVQAYSQASIANIEVWPVDGSKQNEVRVYVRRSEVQKMFQLRVDRAKDMMQLAEEELQTRKVDMALEYYYWAYCLVRSVQYPSMVKDEQDRVLLDIIARKIREILSDINVKYDKREGDMVDLIFTYKDSPVSSLIFTYNDGRTDCDDNKAKDGRGVLEMAPGYQTDVYHVSIEYEFKNQARGDAEMESVMNTLVCQPFPEAQFKVSAKGLQRGDEKMVAQQTTEKERTSTGVDLTPKESQKLLNAEDHNAIVEQVIKAIKAKNYQGVEKYFTSDGRSRFRSLIRYGQGRVVGTPKPVFFKSAKGDVVVRGLQMSFSFNSRNGKKKTFVEDVVFTFNADRRIDNVTFGLGQVAENDILCKENSWNDETREMLMEFLENYKTAYCLKDSDYIKNVFADDAVIIVGKVARRNTTLKNGNDRAVSVAGQEVITYNRYDKKTYLRNVCRVFKNNEFINIRFTNNDIQWLEKYDKEEIFGIQIGQEYSSSTYADKGFLFLLVNMTDHDSPQIKVRTWQPNEVDMKKIYNAGYFYNE